MNLAWMPNKNGREPCSWSRSPLEILVQRLRWPQTDAPQFNLCILQVGGQLACHLLPFTPVFWSSIIVFFYAAVIDYRGFTNKTSSNQRWQLDKTSWKIWAAWTRIQPTHPPHRPLLPVLVGSWPRGQRSQLIPGSNSTPLSPPPNTIKARSGIGEWLAGSGPPLSFSHNFTLVAGSQKNHLPDRSHCSHYYLKQTQDDLSNSCDAMPKYAAVIISIISGQMLRELFELSLNSIKQRFQPPSAAVGSLSPAPFGKTLRWSLSALGWRQPGRPNFKMQQTKYRRNLLKHAVI